MSNMDHELFTAQFLESAQFLELNNILLDSEQIDWAINLSQQVTSQAEQWQTYLSVLALFGLQAWLQKRAPDLLFNSDWLSDSALQVSPSQAARLSQCVSYLKVGEYKLFLLPTDCLNDPTVAVPKTLIAAKNTVKTISRNTAKITHSDFDVPDFYVLVEVLEEVAQVRVYGYLSQADAASTTLVQQDTDTVLLPISQFKQKPDDLLLHLHVPKTVPASETEKASAAAHILAAAYTSTKAASPVHSFAEIPAINAGLWLNNQLDHVAKELSWMLLPPLNLTGAMMGGLSHSRSPVEDLNAVVAKLIGDHALVISAEARSAYHNLQLETAALRLYALTWIPNRYTEWSLLLVLGAQPGTHLPQGIQLQVEDGTQLLATETLVQDPYLYVQVVGAWNEAFYVTITLPNGAALSLPPFVFQPNGV